MKILIIEDQQELSDSIRAYLSHENFTCETATDYYAALEKIHLYDYACIILDINLPHGNGLTILQELKSDNKADGVLIISARNSLDDKVLGLNLGADDYLTKPFHTEELLARLRALLRRAAGHAQPALAVGGLHLDPRAARASVNGEPVRLTSLEYRLLHYLMMHQEKVISRTELVEHLYDQDFDRDSNTIEVFVGRLRKKIGPDRIETVRGLGYRLSPLEGETA